THVVRRLDNKGKLGIRAFKRERNVAIGIRHLRYLFGGQVKRDTYVSQRLWWRRQLKFSGTAFTRQYPKLDSLLNAIYDVFSDRTAGRFWRNFLCEDFFKVALVVRNNGDLLAFSGRYIHRKPLDKLHGYKCITGRLLAVIRRSYYRLRFRHDAVDVHAREYRITVLIHNVTHKPSIRFQVEVRVRQL